MTTPTNPITRLDRPLADLEADMKALVARQQACQVLAEAAAHTLSPSDRLAYAMDAWLLTHPEACSTADDYPNWQPGRAS
ncbi:hypothetical protein AB0M57_04295 [Streptomyces sp. NPDC051597]|uniref:hypothetical protein n=1 Tax=Streptomyces sp. NPDC051597 TaxID=3155049 RepID=UPI00343F2AEE